MRACSLLSATGSVLVDCPLVGMRNVISFFIRALLSVIWQCLVHVCCRSFAHIIQEYDPWQYCRWLSAFLSQFHGERTWCQVVFGVDNPSFSALKSSSSMASTETLVLSALSASIISTVSSGVSPSHYCRIYAVKLSPLLNSILKSYFYHEWWRNLSEVLQ